MYKPGECIRVSCVKYLCSTARSTSSTQAKLVHLCQNAVRRSMYAVSWIYHCSQVLQQLSPDLAITFDTHFLCCRTSAVFDCTANKTKPINLSKGLVPSVGAWQSICFLRGCWSPGESCLLRSKYCVLRLIVRCWGCWFNNTRSYFCGCPIFGACHLKKGGTGIKQFNHVGHWWFPRSHFW